MPASQADQQAPARRCPTVLIACGVLLTIGLAAAAYKLWDMHRDQIVAARERIECQALKMKHEHAQLACEKTGQNSQQEIAQVQAQRDALAARLAEEAQTPRGSLGDFFHSYEQFALGLRFDVELQVEYQVSWRLKDEEEQGEEQVSGAEGEASLQQGLWLGQASNFVFGLVALRDNDLALFCPSDSDAFEPPEPVEQEGGALWGLKDKTIEYERADSPMNRLLDVRVLAYGPHRPDQPQKAGVIGGWREASRGFTVLLVAAGLEGEGVHLGPDFLPDRLWLDLTEKLGVYPMTAPNGGVVLHKEHLAESYRADRRAHPEAFSVRDYYRDGWVRPGWDGVPGRVEVVFSPLPPGEQQTFAGKVHSLVFPLEGRRSYWVPYWAVRERLLALPELNLSLVPTWNAQVLGLAVPDQKTPMNPREPWPQKTCRQVFYDLLKRRGAP